MKLKTKIIPLAALAATSAIVAPISLSSCGNTIYDSPINLKDFVANRKNFKRLTTRYTDKEQISITEANANYVTAVQHNKYVFNDDIFEDIAVSPIWEDEGNSIEGSLQIKDVTVEPLTADNGSITNLLSGSANLTNVNFELGSPLIVGITKLGCNGKIAFSKVPFRVYYDTAGATPKWRFKILTDNLDTQDWSISAEGIVAINDASSFIEFTWNKDTTREIIEGWLITTLLGLFQLDLNYYKGIGYSD